MVYRLFMFIAFTFTAGTTAAATDGLDPGSVQIVAANQSGGIDAAATAALAVVPTDLNRTDIFTLRTDLADQLLEKGEADLAYRLLTLALKQADPATPTPIIVRALRQQAKAANLTGRKTEAVATLARAHGLETDLLGAPDPNLRFTISDLAQADAAVGKTHEADQLAARADTLGASVAANRVQITTLGRSTASGAFVIEPVFFVTTRAATGSQDPNAFFGSTDAAAPIRGIAYVSVPSARKIGDVPLPSIYRIDFRDDQSRYVVMKDVVVSDAASFEAKLQERVTASSRKEALVFIHGFRQSFADAVERAAELAVDLRLDGPAIAFSWPSKDHVLEYTFDEDEADKLSNQEVLAALLREVRQKTGAQHIYVVAHSLGNRITLKALELLMASPPGTSPMLDKVVLASADVNTDDFVHRVAELHGLANRFTLYASSRDKALMFSDVIHGMKRAGDASQMVGSSSIMDSVDTTGADDDLIGHDDFAFLASDDLTGFLWNNLAAHQRCLLKTEAGNRWAYAPAAPCSSAAFRIAMTYLRSAGSPANAASQLGFYLATHPVSPDYISARQILVDMH